MKLGVSVYLSHPFAEQEAYLLQANASGFSRLFTSLHIPEDDVSLYKSRLKKVAHFAMKNQMDLICDVSPKSLEHLSITWDEVGLLQEWGVTGLRMDYGIDPEIIANMSKKMQVMLNASTLHEKEIDAYMNAGLQSNQVEVGHNFYPRPETGLGRETFQRANETFTRYGYSVMAFIPGDIARGPLFKRLPTLEDHRDVSPFMAFLDLLKNEAVETIIIGDTGLTDESLEQFRLFVEEDVIVLRAEAIDQELNLEDVHWNRNDAARDVLRSEKSRSLFSAENHKVAPSHTNIRPLGTITIDNSRYGRYQGEVQVTKRDLPADEKVNVVGRVVSEDQPLLQYIEGGQKWMFKWV